MVGTSARPFRVVQISDCHLFADKEGKLLGLNTEFSLGMVLEKVRTEQHTIDAILATGDLSQDGSLASYERFLQQIQTLGAPTYWMQGNHDLTAPMIKALGTGARLSPCTVVLGGWRIIMLNSAVEYEVPGEFTELQLQYLEQELASTVDAHVMVCLHHHPVPMGCAWLDNQVVRNAAAFWQVLDRYSHVRAVVWGHVHQASDNWRGQVRLLSVPSTCVQFTPQSDDFSIDSVSPGYRWFDLYADGRIETQVSRVENVRFDIDLSVKGY